MRDINKIIEMALDFGEFGVHDPFDPEFHKAIAGQRVVIYYPTTSDNFWDVIRNGIRLRPTVKRDRKEQEVFFDTAEASDKAYYMAYEANREGSNGPIQPMIFTAETTFQKPLKANKGEMSQLVGDVMGAEANTILPLLIKPINIVGVIYPAKSNAWEIPIKKFLASVRADQIDAIDPDSTFRHGKYRPYGPTKESWQHTVLRYVNDLLNHSSNLYDYLLGGRTQQNLNDIVFREATKTGLQKMYYWTGRDIAKWLYSILSNHAGEWDTTVEDDIEQMVTNGDRDQHGKSLFERPLSDPYVWKKYSDDSTRQYRSGEKETPELLDY